MKTYKEMVNVGSVKYVVNYHDGVKTHRDGSEFFDMRTFSNRKLKNAFVKELNNQGYTRSN